MELNFEVVVAKLKAIIADLTYEKAILLAQVDELQKQIDSKPEGQK